MNYDEKLLCHECKKIFQETCDVIQELGYSDFSDVLYGTYMKIYKKMIEGENENESKSNN